MTTNEATHWQALMDRGTDRYENDDTYADMLRKCSGAERAAVLLGNLNYQVENGGFRQWVDNGYAFHGWEVVGHLGSIAERNPTTPILADLVNRLISLLRFVKVDAIPRGFEASYWKRERAGGEYADSLDDWYYTEVAPVLIGAVEAYLIGLEPPTAAPAPTDPQDAHDILTSHRVTVEVSRQDVEWMIALLAEREHLVVSLADAGKYQDQDEDPDATADMLGSVQALVCRLRAALPPLTTSPPVSQPDDMKDVPL